MGPPLSKEFFFLNSPTLEKVIDILTQYIILNCSYTSSFFTTCNTWTKFYDPMCQCNNQGTSITRFWQLHSIPALSEGALQYYFETDMPPSNPWSRHTILFDECSIHLPQLCPGAHQSTDNGWKSHDPPYRTGSPQESHLCMQALQHLEPKHARFISTNIQLFLLGTFTDPFSHIHSWICDSSQSLGW